MIISDLGTIITGKTPATKNEEFWNGKVQFVTPGDIQGTKHISSTARYITELGMKSVKGAILPKDAVCVSCIGNIGYVGKTTEQCISNQQINSIIVNEKHNSDYVYYLMKSLWPYFKNYEGQSTTLSILNKGQFSKIEVIEHTRKEEDAIAEILNGIDNKIENNLIINDNLSQQLRLIFQHTFLDGEHPEWPVEKLGSFLSLERGLSYKGKFLSDSEGVPMINLGNILPNSVFRPEKLKYYTGDFKEKVIVKPGDIVVANTDLTQAREVLGSAILIPDLGYSTIICSHHISIVRKCQISKYFIHGMLNSPSYRERVVGFATGTTVLALPNETILNCDFSMPPSELIAEYDTIADSFYQKSEQLRKENQRLIVLRDFLLPRLMSGELDVTGVLL